MRGRRNPYQLWLILAGLAAGLTFAGGAAPAPGSVQAVLPRGLLLLWFGLLIVGGLAGTATTMIPYRRLITRLQLERASVVMLGAGAWMFAISIQAFAPGTGTGAMLMIAAIAAAHTWRLVQIFFDIHHLTRPHESDGELDLKEEPPP